MNLLPLGSIVVLKNGYKKLMVIGRKQIQQSENKIWDYLGVLYPEGYLGLSYTFLFPTYPTIPHILKFSRAFIKIILLLQDSVLT